MDFAIVAQHSSRLEATTKRLERTAILVDLFRAAPDGDTLGQVVRFLDGKIAPDWEGLELGLAEKLVVRAIAKAGGTDAGSVTKRYHDTGDLGSAAEAVMATSGSRQSTLFGPEPLTVAGVVAALEGIARAQGAGSQDLKQQLLAKLLTEATPLEARFITRFVAGRLRLGVNDMGVLDALAICTLADATVKSVTERAADERQMLEGARARLEAAYDRCSDLPRVARALAAVGWPLDEDAAPASQGLAAVDEIPITLGIPLRPMAAERLKTLHEILAKIGEAMPEGGTPTPSSASGGGTEGGSGDEGEAQAVAIEVKYDGLRMQAHVPRDPHQPVRLFSRRMEELTAQFPDVQAMLRAAHRGPDCIVEMECVAVDAKGFLRPFQELSRRRGRKTGLGEDQRQESALADGGTGATTMMDEVPVAVFLFDCLAMDGKPTMDEPYLKRREQLAELFQLSDRGDVRLSHMRICGSVAAAESWFLEAVQEGGEGIMAKRLSGVYKAGNRGFDWIKYKTDYTEDLVDTMDLVVVGAFHGRGRRAGWYGALLMAARDGDADTFPTVCKLGTGFDDAALAALPERLDAHKSQERPAEVRTAMEPDVWFTPAVVAEVQAAEMTMSPVHHAGLGRIRPGAGIAARFPRFTGWRDDKGPDQATTVDELVYMFESQGERAPRADA